MKDLIIRRTLNGKTVRRLTERVGEKKLIAHMEERWDTLDEKIKKSVKDKDQLLRDLLPIAKEKKALTKAGKIVYSGEDSLIGEIHKRGYRVDPQLGIETADIEIPQTTAGDFTIDRYGSHNPIGGMDAFQLIIGGNYRRTHNYAQTGRDIGNAIWSFAQNYNLIPPD